MHRILFSAGTWPLHSSAHAPPRSRPTRRPRATRSSFPRSTGATSACRSSRRTISRSALFVGTYATQNFGTSAVGGVRLGYHITEDFFVEASTRITKVSDTSFRQILPGGVFPDEKAKLSYYNVSFGYNVLPGEVFIGAKRAKPRSST
jgi:hypothetical protein